MIVSARFYARFGAAILAVSARYSGAFTVVLQGLYGRLPVHKGTLVHALYE